MAPPVQFGWPGGPTKRKREFPFEFEGPIVPAGTEDFRQTVIYLPEEIAAQLPLARHPRLRISGEIGRASFRGAWQPQRGRWFLMVSRRLLAGSGYQAGDLAQLRFQVEAQDDVEVPDELTAALAADRQAAAAWRKLTPGKRRGLAHHVSSAKTPATRGKRAAKTLAYLRGEIEWRIGGK